MSSAFQQIFGLSHYYLNPYSVPPLLVAALSLIFGFFLFYLEKKPSFNKAFLYFCMASSFWLFACVLVLNSKAIEVATFWAITLLS
jgi:hypothetical protein